MSSREKTSRPKLWIKTITFSDGTMIEVHPGDIVVMVGPNNIGKSVALKNIEDTARDRSKPGIVVTDADICTEGCTEGAVDSLLNWLKETSKTSLQVPSNPQYRQGEARGFRSELDIVLAKKDAGLEGW